MSFSEPNRRRSADALAQRRRDHRDQSGPWDILALVARGERAMCDERIMICRRL